MLQASRMLSSIALVLSLLSCSQGFQSLQHSQRGLHLQVSPSPAIRLSLSSSASDLLTADDGTIATWNTPSGQTVTLIGTAHLSKKSNEQVKQVIEKCQPNIVMVELDPARLSRIGINSVDDIQLEVVTSEDIELPNQPPQPWYWLALNLFAQVARKFLTGMYNSASKDMKNNDGGGGEFLAAIRSAEACPNCHKLILGDRDSVTTIRRTFQLAIESGNPFALWGKFSEANQQEMDEMQRQVQQELGADGKEVDSGELQVAMMERLKSDSDLRDRLFAKLEQEVPEFTQAFLKERDYIMGQAIGRELTQDPSVKQVVAVVGLAHVPGIQAHLEGMFSK
ncbi:unnamed protein product [Cylindrotheca closterium]|uniref:TraB family protein n=1 Tax=Cylindrotheca closterium TaxID=2856 RepID=A0AAD2FX60_9STRA|nr:unnamed protein product [Cylindrotheca closterium]